LAFLCIGLSWGVNALLFAAEPDKAEVKGAKKPSVAQFKLEGDFAEGVGAESLFGEGDVKLKDLLDRLDKARKDDKISAVILQLRSLEIGRAKIDELRAAVAKLRAAGKRVIADLQTATGGDYLVALACDEIVMPESGMLLVPGVRAELTYYKGLFDKLGIQADFIQIGDYKGAEEAYTRTNMSPQFHQQFESVIDDYYEQLVGHIAQGRKLEAKKVKDLLDQGMFSATEAKAAGLIDRVEYEETMHTDLAHHLKADDITLVADYGKPDNDAEMSGLSGMMKMMELMMGGGEKGKKPSKNRKIAIVYAVGVIMPGESSFSAFSGQTVGSDTIIKALREAEDDPKCLGVVLRVDSPGGSATASDLIWRQITQSKKPFIASMGDTAASGGYYISMGAKKIFAEPGTLTGSIGVVSGKLALKGLMDKVGVTTDVVSRGKNSSMFSQTEPFTESERTAWKRTMTECYEQFTSKAAQGRKMDVAKLRELAQGKLYSGRMAKKEGLVDAVGTLDDALADLKVQAGLKPDDKVELWVLPKPRSVLESMFGLSGASSQLRSEVKSATPEFLAPLLEAEMYRKLFSEPNVMLMPCRVKIR
jgi:protease-4